MKPAHFIFLLIIIASPGCIDLTEDSSNEFPDCVGIKESFDPYNIQKAYRGRIWNSDTTISTQFIFTEYRFDVSILRKSWVMYIKLKTGPTTTTYQSASCFRSSVTDYWYASTGFDFNGNHTSWDFNFEKFDCSSLSGQCEVIRTEISDTLNFNFEGNR